MAVVAGTYYYHLASIHSNVNEELSKFLATVSSVVMLVPRNVVGTGTLQVVVQNLVCTNKQRC
jgi:hypothetical protein